MKKLALLFCLFTVTVAQAQTKEETIEWINLYASDYLRFKDEPYRYVWNAKVDSTGKITVTTTTEVTGSIYNSTGTVSATDIVSILISDRPDSSNSLYYMYINIKDSKQSDKAQNFAQIYIRSFEDLNRVYKALVKYASFFGYKEKAKVARDTF